MWTKYLRLNQKRSYVEAKKDILLLLRQHLLKFIRRSCSFKSSYGPHIDRTYSDFFNSIGNSFQGASLNPEGQVRYDDSWTIFTTNYDRCLEYFWRDCHKGVKNRTENSRVATVYFYDCHKVINDLKPN